MQSETKMELIRKSLWSTAYKSGDLFVKQLNFHEPEAAQREADAAQIVYDSGIHTPQFIANIDKEGVISLYFKYIEFNKLTNQDVLRNSCLLNQLNALFVQLSNVKWNKNDKFWYNHITKEFEYELSLIGQDTSKYKNFMYNLKPEVFIHGDCSVYNMGLFNDKILIFDFQHGSIGPRGWDKAYFASTMMMQESIPIGLNEIEKRMAILISAVKLGRAIKKGLTEMPLRKSIYQSWESLW